jgi:hypothetical protein
VGGGPIAAAAAAAAPADPGLAAVRGVPAAAGGPMPADGFPRILPAE